MSGELGQHVQGARVPAAVQGMQMGVLTGGRTMRALPPWLYSMSKGQYQPLRWISPCPLPCMSPHLPQGGPAGLQLKSVSSGTSVE